MPELKTQAVAIATQVLHQKQTPEADSYPHPHPHPNPHSHPDPHPNPMLTLTLTRTPALLNPNPNANPITLALAQVHLMNQKQRLGMSDAVAIRQLVDESQQKVNQLLGVQQTRRELAKGFTRERLHAYP